MIIYPAIDIKDGECVRLLQGRADEVTVYGDDPVETALNWESQGAQYLHVVDLNGAFEGRSVNEGIIKNIVKAVSIPIQLGGGIRSMDRIQRLLDEYGVQRVILGTAAVENRELIEGAVKRYGSRIVVGIDARKGMASTRGWTKETDIPAVELGRLVKEIGIETVIYTDIARDGMLKGPNRKETKDMIEKTGLNIIASGGISRLEDIEGMKEIGAAGVIVGKALYTGALTLSDALRIGGN